MTETEKTAKDQGEGRSRQLEGHPSTWQIFKEYKLHFDSKGHTLQCEHDVHAREHTRTHVIVST